MVFILFIWACLCLCVLFRSPAQRKASFLSPTHSTSARTVLKLEETQTRKQWLSRPYRFKVLPTSFEPPRKHGCTCLRFRGLVGGKSVTTNKFQLSKMKQLNYIAHKKTVSYNNPWHVTYTICCEISLRHWN